MQRLHLMVVFASACTVLSGYGPCGGLDYGPVDTGFPSAPSEPAPTGTRWEGVPVEACGRSGIEWILVDEICGGTEQPGYLDGFHAPMFRDGVRFGDDLLAVDATHVWVLDVSDPGEVERRALVAGLGQPLAVEMYGDRLIVAAGGEGLVIADFSTSLAPRREATVPLPGPALNVFVDGDTAYVPSGGAGLGAVNLAAAEPEILRMIPVPGFAAAVVVRNGLAFVAACSTFAVVDLASGEVVGRAWLPDAYRNDRLVAPAKDVALVDDVAFVAAGRYGAVAVDVSDPTVPRVLGNCTVAEDPAFYASGVDSDGEALFVAAGEWGVLSVPADDPMRTCSSTVRPDIDDPTEATEEDCSSDPPWVVMPWQELWSPPPAGRDPVEVLAFGDVVYAFGDARRVGIRAVDIREAAPALARLGRYDEPQLVTDIAAHGGRVVVVGNAGGVFERDADLLLVRAADSPAVASEGVAAALFEDGRWVIATPDGTLHVEGLPEAVSSGARVWPHGIATMGGDVLVPASDALVVVAVGGGDVGTIPLGRTAELPAAIVAGPAEAVVAAPEWTAALQVVDGRALTVQPHGIFDATEIMDASRWTEGLPRRLLALTHRGVVEVATLGHRAGLVLHATPPGRLDLPAGSYTGAAAADDLVYVVSHDRRFYRSQLVTVDLSGGIPSIVSVEAFTGVATGIAVDGDRLYVADADRGIRVYSRNGAELSRLGIVDPGAAPRLGRAHPGTSIDIERMRNRPIRVAP